MSSYHFPTFITGRKKRQEGEVQRASWRPLWQGGVTSRSQTRTGVVHHRRHPEALAIRGTICQLSASEARPHQSAAARQAAHLGGVMESLPQQVMSRRIAAVSQEQRRRREAERKDTQEGGGPTQRSSFSPHSVPVLFASTESLVRCWWKQSQGF